MKYAMGQSIMAILLGIGLMLSSAAWAGNQHHPEVEIENSIARGSMVGARQGPGEQRILCGMSSTEKEMTLYCTAVDENDKKLSCRSNDIHLYEAISNINASSRVSFEVDGEGLCTSISIYNSSSYLP